MIELQEQVNDLSERVENLERVLRKFINAYNNHIHDASNSIRIYSPTYSMKQFQTPEEKEEAERREAMYAEEDRKARERTDETDACWRQRHIPGGDRE